MKVFLCALGRHFVCKEYEVTSLDDLKKLPQDKLMYAEIIEDGPPDLSSAVREAYKTTASEIIKFFDVVIHGTK